MHRHAPDAPPRQPPRRADRPGRSPSTTQRRLRASTHAAPQTAVHPPHRDRRQSRQRPYPHPGRPRSIPVAYPGGRRKPRTLQAYSASPYGLSSVRQPRIPLRHLHRGRRGHAPHNASTKGSQTPRVDMPDTTIGALHKRSKQKPIARWIGRRIVGHVGRPRSVGRGALSRTGAARPGTATQRFSRGGAAGRLGSHYRASLRKGSVRCQKR
jgi:hypothetical protein